MVVATTTLLFNAALDPFLMFGWGGLPALGLAGAGWATVVATGVGLLLYGVALRARGIKLGWRWPDGTTMRQITRIGGPSMLSGIGFCLVYVALGDLLARFGPSALAGLGLGHRLEGPAFQICSGFGAAAATLVGQHLGAGQRLEAARAAHRTARWACAVMAPLSLLFMAAPRWLVSSFSPDPETIDRGASYLLAVGLILAPMALEVVYESAFAGSGETWTAMTIVVVFTAARIPLAWWLSGVFGLEAVWWTIAGTCALKGLLLWGAFAWRSRREDWGAGGRLA
jgi:putative MATE family efflux protein